MTHEAAWERLPDLLLDRDDRGLLAHVKSCHLCQARLFRLARVDRVLRGNQAPSRQGRMRRQIVATAMASVVAAAAAAAAMFVFAGHRSVTQPARLALHTLSGNVVARALITPTDGENQSIALVAHHLPTGSASTYLLWTRAPRGGRAVIVGRFMVSHDGECRARFNLAGVRHSSQFWITRATAPTAVVATT